MMQEQDTRILKRALNGILSSFDYQDRKLSPSYLKELKLLVRKDETVIEDFTEKLFDEFRKNNSDRRLGAILVTDYFFQRSHKFRLEVIDRIQDLFLLTIECDPIHYPLPLPIEAAVELKKESLKIIKTWVDKFARGYLKLNDAFQYLKQCKNFDFLETNEQFLVERQRVEKERLRQAENNKKIGKRVKKEFKEAKVDIERCLAESQNSMKLLFPDVFKHYDSVDANSSLTSTQQEFNKEREKLHGYKKNENIHIVIHSVKIKIKETPDNSALINVLRDAQILLNNYHKAIKKWLKTLIQTGEDRNPTLFRMIIAYKHRIEQEMKRFKQLDIKQARHEENEDSADDSDFEDVEMSEEVELGLASKLSFFDTNDEKGQEKAKENFIHKEPQPSTSKLPTLQDENVKAEIPKIPFGLDLKYWGKEVKPAIIPRNEFDGHRFWRALDPDDTTLTEIEDVYRSRQMIFVGERPVIKHQCRAPLSSGKLCPRQDFKNCPFHGPIIPRDDMGFPIDELGKGSLEHMNMLQERIQNKVIQEEREYLQDLEAATGVSLAIPDKNDRKRRANNSAYGTARKREKTQTAMSRERLTKKLFNKSAIKRVTDTLTSIQQHRASKPFSSQFNYALTRH